MSRRRTKPMKFVSFMEMSDNIDELLEVLQQAESLNVQAENELKLRRTERELIKARLKKARITQELRVSDHAVVRYLERVVGIDIEACKKEMIAKVPKSVERFLDPIFVGLSTDEKFQYVIRDNLIISVTPKGDKDARDTV